MSVHQVVVDIVAKGQQAAQQFRAVRNESEELGVEQGAAAGKSQLLATGLRLAAAAGGALVATKLVGFAEDSVRAYTNLASRIRGYQRVTGASAEESSKMVFALDTLGISADKGSTSMFRLAQRIGQGKVDLSKYGVEVKKTADGGVDLEATLLNISDAYNSTHDPARRAALVMDAFGRSGKDLIPVLARGREGIKQLFDEAGRTNHILDQGDLDRAKEFQLAAHELGATFEGLKVKVGNALTPMITDITEITTDLVQMADAIGVFDAMGAAEKVALGPLTGLVKTMKAFTDQVGLTHETSNRYVIVQKALNEAQSKYASLVLAGNGKTKEARDLRQQIIGFSKALGPVERELGDISANASDKAAAAAERHKAAVEREKQAIEDRNTATIASFSSQIQAIQATNQLAKDAQDGADALTLQQDALQAAGAKAQFAADQFEGLNARQATAEEKATFFKLALKDLEGQFPQLTPLIEGYIGQLNQIPPAKHTTITADATSALDQLRQIIALKQQAGSPVVIPVVGGHALRFASGGLIPGAAGQAVPIIAHGGEYVLSEDVVRRIKQGRASAGASLGRSAVRGGDGASYPAPEVNVYLQLDGRVIANATRQHVQINPRVTKTGRG